VNIDNNDLLTRSLAQLAGDPATEAEAAHKSAQFAAALRRLDTDPKEAARIEAIANAVPIPRAIVGEPESDSEEGERQATPAHPDLDRDEPIKVQLSSPDTDAQVAARTDDLDTRQPNYERRPAKHPKTFGFGGDAVAAAVVIALAICASVVAILASSPATTTFVGSSLAAASAVQVCVRSVVVWMSSRDLVRRGRAETVLRIMLIKETKHRHKNKK
jgi:hypothetical protein